MWCRCWGQTSCSGYFRNLIYWDFYAGSSRGFKETDWSKKERISVEQLLCERPCSCQRRTGRTGLSWQKDNSSSNNHFLQMSAEYHLWAHNRSNLDADVFTAAEDHTGCHWPESQVTVHTGSPTRDNKRLEKRCLIWWVSINWTPVVSTASRYLIQLSTFGLVEREIHIMHVHLTDLQQWGLYYLSRALVC